MQRELAEVRGSRTSGPLGGQLHHGSSRRGDVFCRGGDRWRGTERAGSTVQQGVARGTIPGLGACSRRWMCLPWALPTSL